MQLHFEGILIGFASLLVIGVFHPIVIWAEYYFSARIWPLFLAAGILLFASRSFRRQMDLAMQPAAGAIDDYADDADEDDVHTHDSGSHAEDGEDADGKGFV